MLLIENPRLGEKRRISPTAVLQILVDSTLDNPGKSYPTALVDAAEDLGLPYSLIATLQQKQDIKHHPPLSPITAIYKDVEMLLHPSERTRKLLAVSAEESPVILSQRSVEPNYVRPGLIEKHPKKQPSRRKARALVAIA